ncbi:CD123 protein, partial [Scopus umbretta]|nr:CD123 protein [Scopus umbretta]
FIHCTDDSPDPSLDYELVLRKWCELIPGAEFRCFVKENKLIGISQRDYTQYYDHISKQHEEICRSIQEFFKKHIQYKFLDEDFVFDVYRDSRGKIWLIDFNPFGEVTDSLLFTWEELTSGKNLKGDQGEGAATEQDYPVFRCTNSKVTVQPSPYLSYRLPKDFVDLSTGEDVHKLIDFLKLVRSNEKKK